MLTKASAIWAIALAEMRTSRRLVRTWIFIVIACLLTIFQFMNLSVVHATTSSISASAGNLGPRFLMGAASSVLIMVFEIGIIFLAFDVRNRDRRDRIAAVLDSRPFTNLDLLFGRLAGITLLLVIPSVTVVVLLSFGSFLLYYFEAPFGDVIEPLSVLSFLTVDLIPNLAFWGALTIFLAVLLRVRLLVMIAMLGLVVGYYVISTRVPSYMLEPIATVTATVIYPSDLAPTFTNGMVLIQRLSMLLFIAGLLVLGALLYPRPDGGSKALRLGSGVGCLAIAVLLQTMLFQNSQAARDTYVRFASVHESHADKPRADIVHIAGSVVVDPGDELEISYQLTFITPENKDGEVLFAFNPGFEITSLKLDDAEVSHEFEDGLIRIQPTDLRAGETRELSITATGAPDVRFGYLDSALNVYTATVMEGQSLALLGYDNGVFHDAYVALMPAIKWYPTAGPAFREDDYERFARDQFTVDLEVTVPRNWIVAGPGSRETLQADGQTKFRFAPRASVPEVALLGSRFTRRSIDIAGVEFELLLSPKHIRNLAQFAPVMPVLETRVEEMFGRAEKLGLEYPYDMLSIVEIPTFLRVYGGGWRMDSVHAAPGIFMLRETGFPTARFENRLDITEEMKVEQDYVPEHHFTVLSTYFSNDMSGGNPFITVTRNFMEYQTNPTGRGAHALAYVVNALTTRFLTERTGFFSTYLFGDRFAMQQIVSSAMVAGFSAGGTRNLADNLKASVVERPQVWEGVISTALSDLDYFSDSKRALNALSLKGDAVAESLNDAFGAEKIGQLLAALRNKYEARPFTFEDFEQTAAEVQIDIDSVVGDWLNERELPGFQVYEPTVVRLPDDELGVPIYQTTFYLTNEEPAPGLVNIDFEERRRGDMREGANKIPPIRVDGNSYNQIALQSEYPVERLMVHPYLSLNRTTIEIDVDEPDSWDPQNIDQLPLQTSVDWRPQPDESIIVDDLDDGFVVHHGGGGTNQMPGFALWLMRNFSGMNMDQELDQGLPAYSLGSVTSSESQWFRRPQVDSWGKYRHTTALAMPRGGDAEATFKAQLTHNGHWQLEYHFPFKEDRRKSFKGRANANVGWSISFGGSGKAQGNYSITVKDGEESIPVEFDVSIAPYGWNRLGEFLLREREVDVSIRNSGSMEILADAIRWTPIARTN